MEREGLTGFELMVLVVGAVAAAAIGIVWAGASLALLLAGESARVPASAAVDALGRLPSNLGEPASAWAEPIGSDLPVPALYWTCTAVVAVSVAIVVALVVRWIGRSRVGTSKRRPLGVDARPQFARRRELAPLLIDKPVPGRFVVARFGRSLVVNRPGSDGGSGYWIPTLAGSVCWAA